MISYDIIWYQMPYVWYNMMSHFLMSCALMYSFLWISPPLVLNTFNFSLLNTSTSGLVGNQVYVTSNGRGINSHGEHVEWNFVIFDVRCNKKSYAIKIKDWDENIIWYHMTNTMISHYIMIIKYHMISSDIIWWKVKLHHSYMVASKYVWAWYPDLW